MAPTLIKVTEQNRRNSGGTWWYLNFLINHLIQVKEINTTYKMHTSYRISTYICTLRHRSFTCKEKETIIE